MADENQAETISALTLEAIDRPVILKSEDGREFLITPEDMRVGNIDVPNKADVLMPKVVTQHVKMQTADSLVDYINRFKNEDTLLFADMANNAIVAIVDYHAKALQVQVSLGASAATPEIGFVPPKLALHRATLALPFSLEWQTWTRASGKLMSHLEFATFLEENAIDIKNPVGADLLELCRDLQVHIDVSFGSTVRMGDYTEINYKKDTDASKNGTIKLPQSIMLSIPVYFGEAPVPIMAFMRRRIDDGALFLGIQLSRAENVRQNEFHRIVDSVKEDVDHLTTVYGTPA